MIVTKGDGIYGTDWVRTNDLVLMRPGVPSANTTAGAIIDEFVAYKKVTEGLIPRDEHWLKDMADRLVRDINPINNDTKRRPHLFS